MSNRTQPIQAEPRPRLLTFREGVRIEVIEGRGVVVLTEQAPTVLRGPVNEAVAPLVDGTRSADAIAEELRERFSADEVHAALRELERLGLAVSASTDEPLAGTKVTLQEIGDVTVTELVAALSSEGVGVDEDGALDVVVTDHYLRAGLQEHNEAALHTGRTWMLAKPVGREIWIGPIFRPDGLGCWECLAQRLRLNRPVETYLQEHLSRTEPVVPPATSTAASLAAASNVIAMAVSRWLREGSHPDLEGRVMTMDLSTWQTHLHELVWRPQCPACGDPGASRDRSVEPIVLQSRPKTFVADGGHRVVSPQRTVERFGHHVSPVTGAVAELERSVTSASVLHVYRAGLDMASAHAMSALRPMLGATSSGKGATDAQARASALAEALERYSGMFRGDEPRRLARMKELGDAAIHPNDCMRFSERQYDSNEDDHPADGSHMAPVRFDADAEIEWTPVWSLTRREPRFLPTAFCYMGYPAAPARRFSVGCSNGNAAGNTVEEAVLQGFFELVERDAIALWWYNRISRPAVDVNSFADPYVDEMRKVLKEMGRDFWVLDITSDLGIPVFVAISPSLPDEPRDVYRGFGAHFDARICLLRAITEMNQKLASVLSPWARREERVVKGWPQLDLEDEPQMVPDRDQGLRTAADTSVEWSEDLREDILAGQAIVEQRGMEMLVLDQTRPDIGLPVVKVIVPGLRHFWPRFGPGRLYDVPVSHGWLPAPLAEDQLNPVPIA